VRTWGVVAVLCAVVLCAVVLLGGCTDEQTITVSGCVFDARDGSPIQHAELRVLPRMETALLRKVRVHEGWFVLGGLLAGDTVHVTADGCIDAQFVVTSGAQGAIAQRLRRDVWLDPVMDTAWTADGPVDATLFLDRTQAARKKLSRNEVRVVARALLPDARIRTMTLLEVGEREEWMIEVGIGHAAATLYLDARSGVLRSAESNDRLLDRRLQQMLRAE
jgi:hypothetical protein